MTAHALIIDDSRAMRTILGNILHEIGFAVVEAGDGEQGLACLRDNPQVELALVDWNLPVMNGLDFVHRVREDRAFERVRLMMVTTETEIERVTQALDAGADEYIMKPFSKDMLLEKLTVLGIVPTA